MLARICITAVLWVLAFASLAQQAPEAVLPAGWTICKPSPKPAPGRPRPPVEVSVTCAATPPGEPARAPAEPGTGGKPPDPKPSDGETPDGKPADNPPPHAGTGAPGDQKQAAKNSDAKAFEKSTDPSMSEDKKKGGSALASVTWGAANYLLIVSAFCVLAALILMSVAVYAATAQDARFAFRRDWGGFGGGGGEGWHLSTPLVLLASALVLVSLGGFLGMTVLEQDGHALRDGGSNKQAPATRPAK
jgi:hypothetical protein